MHRASLFLSLAVVVGVGAGCDGAAAEAPPSRVTLPLSMSGSTPTGIDNEHGYVVDITRAQVHVGPIRFFEGDVVLGDARSFHKRPKDVPQQLIDAVLGMPTALAHPGHYTEGDAKGEWLDDATVDLLAGDVVLGDVDGVTGHHGSASIGFSNSDDLDGAAIVVEGVAHKDGVDTAFHGSLDKDAAVEGIDVRAEVAEAGGSDHIEVQFGELVKKIDFAQVDTGAGVDGALVADTQPFNAFERGCDSTLAFTFTFTEN